MKNQQFFGKRNLSFILLFLILSIFLSLPVSSSFTANQTTVQHPMDISYISYAPHSPINITHFDNITSLDLPGSGTHNDPYLIEGFEIFNPIGGYCISITLPHEVYVTIRLCRLSGAQEAAIYFDGRYCGLVSSEISNSSIGVLIEGDGSRIDRCEITNCSTGIFMMGSSNRVTDSVIQNCEWGVISEGEGVQVEHSYISDCSEIGLKMTSNGDPYSGGSTVHSINNTITYSSTGIELHGQVFLLITNTFTHNRIGIKSFASESQFSSNHIYDNNDTQARDDGSSNYWGYYWHGGNVWKHIIPGQPLPINGSAGSVDIHPKLFETDPPVLSHPDDINFTSGDTAIILTWEIVEVNPGRYYLFDGVSWQDGFLEESVITLNVSHLSVGVHTIELHVEDLFGLWAYDEVVVTVFANPLTLPEVAPVVAGLGVVILIVIILAFRRRS